MNTFKEVPATQRSLTKRKPVYGLGINDAGYITHQTADGGRVACPYYRVWKGMLKRCYSRKYHQKQPTYRGCTVCNDWLLFSNFRKWMETQGWYGNQLDKDILIEGNKQYGPEVCVFIDDHTNKLLNDHAASRGEWPQGVSFNKRICKYQAKVNISREAKHLGYFKTPEEAESAYKIAKSIQIKRVANLQKDDRVKSALLLRAKNIRSIEITAGVSRGIKLVG